MRNLTALLIVCCMISCNTEDWIPLFDGESLDGWSVKCVGNDRDKQYWTVVDGVIQCNSMGDPAQNYVWLQYDQEYEDFELKLKFRGFRESRGNSGVQFRSRYDDSDSAPSGGWLDGPQVDINPPKPFRNGLIYDETRTEKRWIGPSLPNWQIKPEHGPEHFVFKYSDEGDGWNDMRIRCEGTHITTWVNGVKIREFNGEGLLNDESHQELGVGMRGFIALQLHEKKELKIQFKELFLRVL